MPASADIGQDVAEAQQRIDSLISEAEQAAQPSWGIADLLDGAEKVAQAEIAYARLDPRMFIPYVMRDEHTGKALVQQPIHDEWQRLANEHNRLILWAAVELGKALALDTPIPTPAGWSTMGKLRVGQRVFDSHGMPCLVTFTTPVQHGRVVYRVRFDDGGELLADADHLWLASTGGTHGHGPLRVVSTQQMVDAGVSFPIGARRKDGSRYHQYKWRIPLSSVVQYPHQDLPVHPYVLGAWLGDGDSQGPTLTCSPSDRFIADRCRALEGGDCPEKLVRGTLRVNIGGFKDRKRNYDPANMRRRLRLLGVISQDGHKGHKHIPEQYLRSSEEQRRELLAGLLDTDGCVDGAGDGRVSFDNMTQRLAYDVLELVRSLGFKATIHTKAATLNGRFCGTCYRVGFTPRAPVFRLPRKLARQTFGEPFGRTSYRSIVSIEATESVPVQCISVDSPDHSYLAGRDYTVTHNTQQLSVGRTLWLLGNDPSARIVVVSNTYNQSAKIVKAISDYIERSEELHRVFPELLPDKNSGWTTHSLTVKRSVISKDPSLQTCGVHGNIQGARIDYLILDDVLDYENTRTAEGRQDLCDWYHSALAGRLTEHARVLIVGTAFHPDDLLHRLAKTPTWASFRFPVADENGVSVWPERWPPERIAAKRAEFGPLEAARQMFCVARDDAQARFKREWLDICLRRGEGKKFIYALDPRSMPPGCATYTGVDLAVQQHSAADLTVLFTIMLYPNEDREIICIESGRWAGPEILNRIVDTHRRYNSQIIVENNAAQDYIVQMLHSSSAIPVRGYTTGRNKAHPEYGVEHLASELAAGKWIIPCENGRMHPEIEAWINELLFYDPAAHTGDRVMACWLAKEGIRMGSIVAERGRIDLLRR